MNQNEDPANFNPDMPSENINNNPNKASSHKSELSEPAKSNIQDVLEYIYIKDITEEKVKEEIDKIVEKEEEKEVMKELEDELNKISDDEEEDEDKDEWIPKYKDCKCCYGFVYNCKGEICDSLGQCYCKMKDDVENEENNKLNKEKDEQ